MPVWGEELWNPWIRGNVAVAIRLRTESEANTELPGPLTWPRVAVAARPCRGSYVVAVLPLIKR